ncbi:MAG: hypothetical protein DRP55_05295 [Spirochaetes bacterium]|nr:TRAP transporter fused permease subunit [Deltaproteobacteria bacterium]RKY00758.1 MAG: hypothetical protein DRP55_05295 [Spirochaetota bacterium]
MASKKEEGQEIRQNDKIELVLKYCGLTLCAFLALFTFYTIVMGQFTAQVQRGTFLLAAGLAVFTLKPFHKKWAYSDKAHLKWANRIISFIFMGMLTFAIIYLFLNYFEIAGYREGIPNRWDLICYTLGTITVLEAVRRTEGWPLLSVILLTIIYLFVGHHIPGMLGHQKMMFSEIAELCFGMNGVFGIALAVVANVVYIFIIFGAILRLTGAGDLFIDIAYMLTGKYVGGPAQTAVVASAFFGSINGSGPANVVSTGSFTIPLMIKTGFKPEFAGAVEATASCVGQILPPIMGVGAFIMSEITGISYAKIMVAAVIPSLLYSFSLLANVRLQAQIMGIKPIPASEVPRFNKKLIPKLAVLILAIVVLLYRIIAGQTPGMAGFTGAVVLFIASFFVHEMRPNWRKFIKMLVEGGKDGLSLTISCAGIGIIIGGISATGLGVKFSQAIIGIGQANLVLALIMAALCCVIIGMGLPTAASYLMVVYIAAPAITKLGLPLLTTHLFIFYYAVLSAITPPVALAAYAGAGIAKSNALKTGINAVRLGAVGFILPMLWIYNPELMLMKGSILSIFWAIGACSLAIIAFASSNIGFLRKPLNIGERMIMFVAAFGMASHILWMRTLGLIIGILMFLFFLKPEKGV